MPFIIYIHISCMYAKNSPIHFYNHIILYLKGTKRRKQIPHLFTLFLFLFTFLVLLISTCWFIIISSHFLTLLKIYSDRLPSYHHCQIYIVHSYMRLAHQNHHMHNILFNRIIPYVITLSNVVFFVVFEFKFSSGFTCFQPEELRLIFFSALWV